MDHVIRIRGSGHVSSKQSVPGSLAAGHGWAGRQGMHGDHGGDLQRCTAQWVRAESQLYPLVMSDPDAFERALTVVRAIADSLRAESTVDGLARAFTESGPLAISAADQTGTPIGDLDALVLTAAGFRMRQQEIAAGAGKAGRGEPGAPGGKREEQMQ
jgi:hypothetical protein